MRIKQKIDTHTQCPVVTVDLDKGAELDYEDSSIVMSGAPSFAIMQVTPRDKSPLLTYQLSSHDVSLDIFLQQPLTLLNLSCVLTSFARLVDCAERYSLSLQRVMFDPETIFADVHTGSLTFIYVPSRSFVDVQNDIRKTLVYVCRTVKSDDPSIAALLLRIEDFIRRTAIFTAVDYRKLLKSLNLDYAILTKTEIPQSGVLNTSPVVQGDNTSNFGFDFVQEQARAQEQVRAQEEAQPFAQTHIAAPQSAANVIHQSAPPVKSSAGVFMLTYIGNNVSWSLSEGVFTIGRSPECSIPLTNMAEVSRHHATITKQGDEVYVQDNNSTNGVKVNAQPIAPQTKVRIYPGDMVLIGRAVFRLSCE